MKVDPFLGDDCHVDLAAEQARHLAADGEAQAGAAIAPAGGAVGLLEGLEDELCLSAAMPMPVSSRRSHHPIGAAERAVLELDLVRGRAPGPAR